jgi:NAD(P)-dependent dehydrogenase (short-subunit alcohol dehydrogenase family)
MSRSALVTGAASGLGAAVAARLGADGYDVVGLDLRAASGVLAGDVTSAADVERAVAAASERGPLGAVVTCAGVAIAERLLTREGPHDLDRFRRVVEINLVGTFNALRLGAAAMAATAPDAEGQRGAIVCTASVAAYEGQIGQAAYAASKGGVAALVLPAARDLARDGIRVVGIAPGIFDTPLLAGLPEAARTALEATVPNPARLGRPPEFADLVAHVLANPMLNGETIRLDGALRMAPR